MGEKTRIVFELPQFAGSPAAVGIYDVAGRLVARVHSGVLPGGRHMLEWDGRDLGGRPAASGMYFIRLELDGLVATRTVALIR
jgi:hypothetical protein